jgi:hypothetical protein
MAARLGESARLPPQGGEAPGHSQHGQQMKEVQHRITRARGLQAMKVDMRRSPPAHRDGHRPSG